MKRFGVSLEDQTLEKLDRFVKQKQFPNRSQAIRFLISRYSAEECWQSDRVVAGCLVLVYDHHKPDIQKQLTSIQHDDHDLVLCSQHVHLSHKNCMENITLLGKAEAIRKLSDRLIAVKGIIHGELIMSVIE